MRKKNISILRSRVTLRHSTLHHSRKNTHLTVDVATTLNAVGPVRFVRQHESEAKFESNSHAHVSRYNFINFFIEYLIQESRRIEFELKELEKNKFLDRSCFFFLEII